MERREFLKQGCYACMAMGAGLSIVSLSSCAMLPLVRVDVNGSNIAVDPASFKPGINTLLVRTKQLEYDILLVKKPGDAFSALYMECTHNKMALSPTAKTIQCNEHGSEFDFEGIPQKGPATKQLRTFVVTEENRMIIIHLA